jgi:hypothetical protein
MNPTPSKSTPTIRKTRQPPRPLACRHEWTPWSRSGVFDSTEIRNCRKCPYVQKRRSTDVRPAAARSNDHEHSWTAWTADPSRKTSRRAKRTLHRWCEICGLRGTKGPTPRTTSTTKTVRVASSACRILIDTIQERNSQ